MEYKKLDNFSKFNIYQNGNIYNNYKKHYMKGWLSPDGYCKIKMIDDTGKNHTLSRHRVVAICFIPNPKNYTEVNHIDGNKLNNYVENLEWCNHSQNIKHAWDKGLIKNTEQRRKKISEKSKIWAMQNVSKSAKPVQCIETGEIFESMQIATNIYQVPQNAISNICVGRKQKTTFSKKLNKFTTWRYYNEK